tara:strand:+ start:316 stop:552 length:237 start_codon:yes stop_codon:yes gene_type:complete
MDYRIHIDIPLPDTDEEKSARLTETVVAILEEKTGFFKANGIEKINYRLGHDEDRQKSNYLQKNENGHVTNKKSKVTL